MAVRKTTAYREEYEEAERRTRRRRAPAEETERRPTPFLLRFLSWLGIILLCFVTGYLGTSWMMDALNRKILLKPENRIENQEDLQAMEEAERTRASTPAAGENVKQVSLNLYHVKDNTVGMTKQNFVARTQEDNIKEALLRVLTLSGVPDANKIELLHVFRNAETVFLDLTAPFVSSLNAMGQRQGLLLLTGIVRTMQENFSPIVQVRFLIDSKLPAPGGAVDLSVPWKMPSKS